MSIIKKPLNDDNQNRSDIQQNKNVKTNEAISISCYFYSRSCIRCVVGDTAQCAVLSTIAQSCRETDANARY